MSTTLTQTESRELAKLEHTITLGLSTFLEVGNALRCIRDSRLYREYHGSFEAYLRERWGISRRRAYELIDASETIETVRSSAQDVEPPSNVSQATELAKAPPEEQAKVWSEVVEQHDKPTANHVKEAVQRRTVQAEVVDEPEDEWEDVEDEPEPASRLTQLRSDLEQLTYSEKVVARDWLDQWIQEAVS